MSELVKTKVQLRAINGSEPHLGGEAAQYQGLTIRDAAVRFVEEMEIERMRPVDYREIDLLVTCDAGIERPIRIRPRLIFEIEGLRAPGSNDDPVAPGDEGEW